jgi:hypothetical protein
MIPYLHSNAINSLSMMLRQPVSVLIYPKHLGEIFPRIAEISTSKRHAAANLQ